MLTAIGLALAVAGAPPAADEVRRQLATLEDDVCKANVARDGAFFERFTAAEAIFTTPDGHTLGRDDVLAVFRDRSPPRFVLESCANEDVVVRPLGGAAVVTGIVTVHGKGPDGKYVDRSRYTQTLVWRDGRWQLVAAHGSELPPPAKK